MNVALTHTLAIAGSYLTGAIPFAYLIVRTLRGIDLRTVGSGNVGATNAGRVLGFRYFLIVFALDLAKGFLPAWGLPRLIAAGGGTVATWLPVALALAAILGHNFPVYLGFRGGKGVATSFGALLALEPVASLGTLAAFVIFLLVTRYVSLSSILAGVVFVLLHFARTGQPWSAAEAPLSVVCILLLVLLIVRHRANLARLAQGTEPKVRLGRRRGDRDGTVSGENRHAP
jgi:glycerol-3-phosphate acyltransferase PlsY